MDVQYNGKKSKRFRSSDCLIEQPSVGVIDTFPEEIHRHILARAQSRGCQTLERFQRVPRLRES
jgi:hypothetical protein